MAGTRELRKIMVASRTTVQISKCDDYIIPMSSL